MKFTDNELRSIKLVLTDHLESYVKPNVPKMLSKDLAYLKPDFFEKEPEIIYPFQTALRKVIEEIIMRQVNGPGKEA